jgi:hypothetical protein
MKYTKKDCENIFWDFISLILVLRVRCPVDKALSLICLCRDIYVYPYKNKYLNVWLHDFVELKIKVNELYKTIETQYTGNPSTCVERVLWK